MFTSRYPRASSGLLPACQCPLWTWGSDREASTWPLGTHVQSRAPFWKASIIELTLLNTR